MRRFLWGLLLLSGSVWAENWSPVGKSAEFTMYVDTQSMRRSGNIASAWVMGDYRQTQSQRFPPPVLWVKYDSVKEQKEFDCARGQHRTIKTVIVAGRGGKGEVLYTFGSGPEFSRWPIPSWTLRSSISSARTAGDRSLKTKLRRLAARAPVQ